MPTATPSDPATNSGRSRERFRLARLAIFSGGIEKAVSSVTGAARIALLVWGLTQSDYGLYVSMLGFIATAQLMDFGLQFGLVNAVAQAQGEEAEGRLRQLVATAFAIYTIVASVALLIAIPLIVFAPFSSLLRVPIDRVHDARLIAAMGFASIFFAMPLKVTPASLTGLQQQYIPAIYRTLSSLFQLAALAAVILFRKGDLIAVVAVTCIADPVAGALFALWARIRRPLIAIRFRSASRKYARSLLASGLVFFFTNLANLFKRTFATLVVANALGPEQVPPFSVPFALFMIGLGLSELVAGSLWPGYGEAGARGDWHWVQRAFSVGTKAALTTATFIAILGALSGEDVVSIWTSKIGARPPFLFVWLAVWLVSQAYINALASLLCGLNKVSLVMWASLAEGLLMTGVAAYLVRTFGVVGVAASMAICGVGAGMFLDIYAVPKSTDRRVRSDAKVILKIAASGVVSAFLGWPVHYELRGAPALSRTVLTSACAACCFAVAIWFVVLEPAEKSRTRAWLQRRLGGVRRVPR